MVIKLGLLGSLGFIFVAFLIMFFVVLPLFMIVFSWVYPLIDWFSDKILKPYYKWIFNLLCK